MKRILLRNFCLIALIIAFQIYISQSFVIKSDNASEKPRIILGLSKIELAQNETIGVQVDRVIRIIGRNSPFNATIHADKIPEDASQIVPYMEGARVREMMNCSQVKILPLTPARAKRYWSNDYQSFQYFAADGRGNFPFLISESKFNYHPFNISAFIPANESRETADLILPDTHGFNMIAEQAYIHRRNISLAVACMDLPAKAQAALYLAHSGIDIYAPCDRFAFELINYKKRFGINATILGSAPIKQTQEGAVIGDQPLTIYLDELIVIEYTDRGYPDQYCDAPWRYFNKLNEVYDLDLSFIKVYANAGEAGKVVAQAEALNAKVIGVRICKEEDFLPVALWLRKDPSHRAVLLHSVAYSFGNELFKVFPFQTTFGDLSPVVIK